MTEGLGGSNEVSGVRGTNHPAAIKRTTPLADARMWLQLSSGVAKVARLQKVRVEGLEFTRMCKIPRPGVVVHNHNLSVASAVFSPGKDCGRPAEATKGQQACQDREQEGTAQISHCHVTSSRPHGLCLRVTTLTVA